AIPNYK
ncbi:hypothetical protein D030_3921B, partial [Vibrio parahaemolyticus AQ3810]